MYVWPGVFFFFGLFVCSERVFFAVALVRRFLFFFFFFFLSLCLLLFLGLLLLLLLLLLFVCLLVFCRVIQCDRQRLSLKDGKSVS